MTSKMYPGIENAEEILDILRKATSVRWAERYFVPGPLRTGAYTVLSARNIHERTPQEVVSSVRFHARLRSELYREPSKYRFIIGSRALSTGTTVECRNMQIDHVEYCIREIGARIIEYPESEYVSINLRSFFIADLGDRHAIVVGEGSGCTVTYGEESSPKIYVPKLRFDIEWDRLKGLQNA